MPVWPWYTSVSRTKYKPDAFVAKVASPTVEELLAMPSHTKTFADIMDQTALELLALNEPIFVMWSGGIDSTSVVCAILKNWPKADLSRVTVLCSALSIKENKNFFPHVVKNFKIEQVTHRLEQFTKRGYVVTGEFGDQVLGSDTTVQFINTWGEHMVFEDWRPYAKQVFKNFHATAGEATYESYVQIVDEAPFKLETVFDFCWWINFTQKWQHVKFRCLLSNTWESPGTYFKKVFHFFEGIDFQIWSIYNHDKKIKNNWAGYKYIAKDYIMDYTKNANDVTLMKIPSGPNLYIGVDYNWAIDEDYTLLSKEESLLRIRSPGYE